MENYPEIVYLPWDRPILTTTVDWLLAEHRDGIPALEECLLLLPTRQAGRRLREALTWACKERGGIFPPRTTTPFQLLQSPSSHIASEVACIGHWVQVLEEKILEKCPALFPRLPEQRDFTWRRKMAENLHALRGILMERGWDCAQVAGSEHCQEEPLRWQNLADLEAVYRRRLAKTGLQDLHDAKREATEAPDVRGAKRVILLGVPDSTPVIQQALSKLVEQEVQVQIVIFGPADGEALFDEWGRPLPDKWGLRRLPLDDGQLISAQDEKAQAAEVVARVKPYRKNGHTRVAIGVADHAVLPHLERLLADATINSFNPEGKLLMQTPLFIFLKALQGLLQKDSFAQAAAFLRLPDAWGWAANEYEDFQSTTLLAGLDELKKEHLPATLEDATRLHFEGNRIGNRIMARRVLNHLGETVSRIQSQPLSIGLAGFLNDVFSRREFLEGHVEDTGYLETARLFMERLREWELAMGEAEGVRAADALGLLLDAISRESIFPERKGDAVEIQGWLELPWEDAPHLIVAGCNEGLIPQSIVGDRFLPETLRARLELMTNPDRLARDEYLMELILTTRLAEGRVDLILGRQRASGDPLRPSRVLFRCADDDLPVRVQHLFRDLPAVDQPPAWSIPWSLQPRPTPPIEHLSATAFRSYLACPFRFYLKHALHMEALDTSKRELDALDFGSLVHHVLEVFGLDEEARELNKPEAIHQFLSSQLEKQVTERYGRTPPLPVQVQSQIAERRLYAAALAQAEEHAKGWRIESTEHQFERKLEGMEIRGRIDRIERHEETGAVRVLDYKSSTKANPPFASHTATCNDETPDYEVFDVTIKGRAKERRWVDLQLPLYAWALDYEADSDLQLGYFNLPALGVDTGVQLLEPYTPELQQHAMDCALAIVAKVKAQEFWPPTDKPKYDEFKSILFDQPEATAEPLQMEGAV